MIVGTQLETFATRWNPVVDLGLKVLGTAWIVMTVVSCVMLNDLLRSMGQVAAPVTGGGELRIADDHRRDHGGLSDRHVRPLR